jgi:hypothetical protein
MARGFGSTLGGGTTDKVTTTYGTVGTQMSYSGWFFQRAAGGSSLGVLFAQTGGGVGEALFNSGSTWAFGAEWTTTDGSWSVVRPSLSNWHHLLLTYDGSNTANNPVVYINGSSVTVTRITGPAGTRTPSGANFNIGNRADSTLWWDGHIAEFAIWDRILTAGDATALSKGYSPLFLRNSLKEYVPLLRDNVSWYNAAPTIVGTLVTNHPRVIYPSSSWKIIALGGGGQTLSPPLIASTVALYAPTVTPGAVTVTAPLIDSAAQLFAPTVTPGAVTLTVPLLTNTEVLYAPVVTGGAVSVIVAGDLAAIARLAATAEARPSLAGAEADLNPLARAEATARI